MSTGNARHQAAIEQAGEVIRDLRVNVRTQLGVLRTQLEQLADLADTRQSVGLGFQTPEIQAARARQDAEDRAAARGATAPTNAALGHAWMNAPAGSIPGVHEAPVTMPAVSVAADVLFTLQHHVRRLGRVIQDAVDAADRETHSGWHGAVLAYWVRQVGHTAQAGVDDGRGWCAWPSEYPEPLPRPVEPEGRHPIAREPITSDGTAIELTHQLDRIVGYYANRKGLEHLLRDLDHLERTVADVVDGPARTNHPDPCPWCGHRSLVVCHRAPGRDEMFIACDGKHPCRCDDEWCACQRDPIRNRHEWVNSGRAKNAVDGRSPHSLATLIATRKETALLETKALDVLEQIRAMHQPTWRDDDGTEHRYYVTTPVPPADHVCLIDGSERCDPASDEHLVPACTECQQTGGDGYVVSLFWPCPTYVAADLDQAEPAPSTTPAHNKE